MELTEYTNLETMRLYLTVQTKEYDSLVTDAISSASREVDRRCNRYFGKSTEPSTRVFAVEGNGLLMVDDIADPGSIEIPTVLQYQALPFNGVVDGVPGHPITRIKSTHFCEGDHVEVTAIWGWPAVPEVVREATKMLAAETFMQRDAPLGVKGMDEFGMIRLRERQHIISKLNLYKRYRIEGI